MYVCICVHTSWAYSTIFPFFSFSIVFLTKKKFVSFDLFFLSSFLYKLNQARPYSIVYFSLLDCILFFRLYFSYIPVKYALTHYDQHVSWVSAYLFVLVQYMLNCVCVCVCVRVWVCKLTQHNIFLYWVKGKIFSCCMVTHCKTIFVYKIFSFRVIHSLHFFSCYYSKRTGIPF